MRVPISWLKDFVDITLPVEELAEKLTIAGLEVEAIHYIGIPGGDDKDRSRDEEVEPHRFKRFDGRTRQASVEVVDENH